MRSKQYLKSASWWCALELRLLPTEPMLLPNHFQEVYCIYFKSTGKDTDFQRTRCLPRNSPVFFSSRLLSSWGKAPHTVEHRATHRLFLSISWDGSSLWWFPMALHQPWASGGPPESSPSGCPGGLLTVLVFFYIKIKSNQEHPTPLLY